MQRHADRAAPKSPAAAVACPMQGVDAGAVPAVADGRVIAVAGGRGLALRVRAAARDPEGLPLRATHRGTAAHRRTWHGPAAAIALKRDLPRRRPAVTDADGRPAGRLPLRAVAAALAGPRADPVQPDA